jgi:peptide-methionine (S)-S-oxide reductase
MVMMKRMSSFFAFASVLVFSAGCQSAGTTSSTTPSANAQAEVNMHTVTKSNVGADPGHAGQGTALVAASGHELAAFAEGCFWGSENTFRHVPGVTATAVGYTGGHTERPTYESVCSHTTGHAETVLVEFDPKVVSYEKLVDTFFASHDPTTKNRQGPDVGDQYRSAIFTFSPEQDSVAHARADVAQKKLSKPITTEIAPIPAFWKAEEYHQQYDEKSGRESCALPGVKPS